MKKKSKAFSFVELSIVLIVISLLLVGAKSGKHLIHNAKLNRMMNELRDAQHSFKVFFLIYEQLPGDFDNAILELGDSYDGNNNREIDSTEEESAAWRHLNLSGIYPNREGLVNPYALLNTYQGIYKKFQYADDSDYFDSVKNKNVLLVGGNTSVIDKAFSPRDMYFIDRKIDDALPKQGNLTFLIRTGSNVTDASCTNNSTSYYLASKELGCNMVYVVDIR